MRTPPRISQEWLHEAIAEYIREVRRIRRAGMREAVIRRCHEQGVPVLAGEEMETHIDALEALTKADLLDDRDKLLQFFQEVARSSDGQLSFDQQIFKRLESRLTQAPPAVTDEDLEQYTFVVTGNIADRCTTCRRGHNWTEQQFRRDRSLQRILLGDTVTCPFCPTGHMKVSGVTAVPKSEYRKEHSL